MNSILREGDHPHCHYVPLSVAEGGAINELLELGCKLYYHKGKVRLYTDPQVKPGDVIPGYRALCAPCLCDSVGLDVGTLPAGIGIADLDASCFATSIKDALEGEDNISIENTPSGGLHIWGRGFRGDTPKDGLSVAGVRLEYFTRGRITIIGPGRNFLRWTPISRLGSLPTPLLPARSGVPPEIQEPIPFGRRWNCLYDQVKNNMSLDDKALHFQARYLCKPPLEYDKEDDLQDILRRQIEKRKDQGLDDGESLEESVSKKLAECLADRWIFRLPDREWYKYANGHWSTNDGTSYEIVNEIEEELNKLRSKYPPCHKKKMGMLQFRKLMEDYLKQRLYKTPKPQEGVHFTNGLLVVGHSNQWELRPSDPGLWSFNQCGIAFDPCTQLTDIHKTFLLSLTAGNKLKLNVIRAYLRLLFTNDNSEQFCLYLWGPGATGKSTLVQLLEYILGDASCTLDIMRLTNRFEMKAAQDKILITLPDIPLKVNDAQCSMIKRFVSGDKVVIEIKNGGIYAVPIVAMLLVTSNSKWSVQDRTSGFRRRVLYVLTPKSAVQRDPFLLNKLKIGACGLVNWALGMSDEAARIGQSVEAINELSGGGQDPSGVLEWLFDKAYYRPAHERPLGARKVPLPGSLYESYIQYVEAHGIEPVSYYSFGDVLDDSVRSIGYRDIVTKRRAQGRVVLGISLDDGEQIVRSERSNVVKYLMNTDPWEGFTEESDTDTESEQNSANVDNVDSVDCVDCVDCVDLFRENVKFVKTGARGGAGEEVGTTHPIDTGDTKLKDKTTIRILAPPRRPKSVASRISNLVYDKVGKLTEPEQRKTEVYLSEYPHLMEALSSNQEDWTEDRLLEEARTIIQVDASARVAASRIYASMEERGGADCLELPANPVLSTTMSGIAYPLAKRMEESIHKLKNLPAHHAEHIDRLNKGVSKVVDTSYMLFRLFRRQGSTYFNRECPVKGLFATSYRNNHGYPRLVPLNSDGSGTVACLRRDCKRVIKALVGDCVLPPDLVMEEFDMVACHTGIYVGMIGPTNAPHTWEAYQTGNLWHHVMSKWGGDDIPKKLLKTILYSGLNGASLKGGGSIRDKVMETCNSLGYKDQDGYLHKVLHHPILRELAMFQSSLGRRDKIYLPSRVQPYYGRVEEEMSGKRGGSRYHEGLLSSRALASHEVILLAYMVDSLLQNRLGFPLSLENDGFLLLTRASSRHETFVRLDSFLQDCSRHLLGVNIPLERKV